MSTLKTHNLQSPDAGSVNIVMAPNAGMVVAGLSTYSNQINVGNNIKLGNAGVATATTFVGNLTGNVNATSNLLLQIGGSEKFRIASDGDVIIGGSSDAGYANYADNLTIHGTGNEGITIRSGTTSQGAIYFSDATGTGTGTYEGSVIYDHNENNLRFATNHSEKVRITQAGILLVGHTSSPTSDADKIQAISTSSGTGICLHNYSASAYGNQIAFMKSRSNTIGTNTVLNTYDRIGELNFYGNDGSGRSLGAQMQVRTDGTTTNDNTPAYFAFNTGTNQSMQTRLRISSSGVSCFSKTNASTGVVEPGNFILNVHTGAELNDGIKIVSNHNSGNQNSDSGKLMFCGEGQSNGVYIFKDNAISWGKGDMVFHTKSTANDYTTQLSETARFTAYGRFGLGTGGPGQTTVDSLMHIMGNSDNGDEHCQLTIEDSDDTGGSQIPSIMFKGNGSQLCKIRATSDKPIRIFDSNNAERWLINEYGETVSEESNHGWSTYEMHSKSGGTRFHYRQVGTGASSANINLMRIRRHYWGSGHYKIKVRQTYYGGSAESHFWIHGHAANGNTTSFSINHSSVNVGNSNWIQKTATSHSAPGNNYAGWIDVYASVSAYNYYEIIIEASMMASYSHTINTIGNDGYALHPF